MRDPSPPTRMSGREYEDEMEGLVDFANGERILHGFYFKFFAN